MDLEDFLTKDATYILQELGGLPHVAERLNLPYHTVHSWKKRNRIPQLWWQALLMLDKKQKEDFTI